MSVGLLHVEKAYKEALLQMIGGSPKSPNMHTNALAMHEKMAKDYCDWIVTHDALVGCFIGDVGEFGLLEGIPDGNSLHGCVSSGPNSGLSKLNLSIIVTNKTFLMNATGMGTSEKLLRLQKSDNDQASSFTTMFTSISSEQYLTGKINGPPLVVPSQVHSASLNTQQQSNSSRGVSELLTQFLTTSLNSKDKDAVHTGTNTSMQLHGAVVVYRSPTLLETISSLGGFRILYPLLRSDRSRQIAALRVILDMITSAKSDDFIDKSIDQVILFCTCAVSTTSCESLQVLFDAITVNFIQSRPLCSKLGVALPDESFELIKHTNLLCLLLDISLICWRRPHLARTSVDWLKGICDDVLQNTAKVFECIGIMPFLVMLSSWEIVDLSKFPLILRITSSSLDALDVNDHSVLDDGMTSRRATSPSNDRSNLPIMQSLINFSTPKTPVTSFQFEDKVTEKCISTKRSIKWNCSLDSFNEYVKLQQSCKTFLIQSFKGTSGHQLQAQPFNNLSLSSPDNSLATKSGFTVSHLTTIINFLQFALNEIDSQMMRTKSPIIVNDTVSALQRSIFSNKIGHKKFDCDSSSHRFYWLLVSIINVLDSIIDAAAADNSLSVILGNMLRACLPGNGIWLFLLNLMGSQTLELRHRSLRMLIITFSSPNQKIDQKHIISFERLNGFTTMADQLSKFSVDESIVRLLLSILFSAPPAVVHPVARKEDVDRFIAVGDNSKDDGFSLNHEIAVNICKEKVTNVDIESGVTASMQTSSSSQVGSSFMSIFSWKNSSMGKSMNGDLTVDGGTDGNYDGKVVLEGEENRSDSSLFQSSGSNMDFLTGEPPMIAVSDIGLTTSVHRQKGIHASDNSSKNRSLESADNFANSTGYKRLGPHLSTSAALLSTIGVGGGINDATRAPTENIPIDKIAQSETLNEAGHMKEYVASSIDLVEVHQLFPVIFKALQSCISVDIVRLAMKAFESNMVLSVRQFHTTSNQSRNSKANTSSANHSFMEEQIAAGVERSGKNVESFFSNRDWMINISDCLLSFRRRIDFIEGEAAGSLQDRECADTGLAHNHLDVNSIDAFSDDDQDSAYCHSNADGNDSTISRSISRCSSVNVNPHQTSTRNTAEYLEAITTQFSEPILKFIQSILLLDMQAKPSSNRQWREILRLSTPESSQILMTILFEFLHSLENFPFSKRLYSFEVVMNILRNTALLLEQVLEKVEITPQFCVKAIHAMHLVNYQCPPEVRTKLKETLLPEMRNSYIVRCLLDCCDSNNGNLYTRVLTLTEMNSSLQGYIASKEIKIFEAKQVLGMILTMFVEASVEIKNISSVEPSQVESRSERDNSAMMHRLEMLIDTMHLLLAMVQNYVVLSVDCRKCIEKLFAALPGDSNSYVLHAVLGPFVAAKSDVNTKSESYSFSGKVDQSNDSPLNIQKVLSTEDQRSSVKSIWWGSWNPSFSVDSDNCKLVETHNDCKSSDMTVPSDSNTMIDEIEQLTDSPANYLTTATNELKHVSAQDFKCNLKFTVSPSPVNIPEFIDWLLNERNDELMNELRNRISKEAKPTLRQAEKLVERFSVKRHKHMKSLIEKLTREKISYEKNQREYTEKLKKLVEKCYAQFEGESFDFMTKLEFRLRQGEKEHMTCSNDSALSSHYERMDNEIAHRNLANLQSFLNAATTFNDSQLALPEKMEAFHSLLNYFAGEL
jgi:hypothetical protein